MHRITPARPVGQLPEGWLGLKIKTVLFSLAQDVRQYEIAGTGRPTAVGGRGVRVGGQRCLRFGRSGFFRWRHVRGGHRWDRLPHTHRSAGPFNDLFQHWSDDDARARQLAALPER